MGETWPPKLKEWVATCLGKMTDSNRAEAQAELRSIIADAHTNQTLWTTDWDAIQLTSLAPKPFPTIGTKRKLVEAAPTSKKNKKKNLSQVNSETSTYSSSSSAVSVASFDPNDKAALDRRKARFQREHDLESKKSSSPYGLARSGMSYLSSSSSGFGLSNSMNVDDPEGNPNLIDRQPIVGTNQTIFKEYLRLTSEPKPEQVRPYSVLVKTLQALKNEWRAQKPYNWICSQFKSLRQDLRVQNIRNEFTVQVYEQHARIALESNDMVEYHACQDMLTSLYHDGIPGQENEFIAYRILMLLHGRNMSDINLLVGQLTPQQKTDKDISHALSVQRAMSIGNYDALFKAYKDPPKMCGYIEDHFIGRERIRTLNVMAKAYKTLSIKFLETQLVFESAAQVIEFLSQHQLMFFTEPNALDQLKTFDCKPAVPRLAELYEGLYRKITIKGRV